VSFFKPAGIPVGSLQSVRLSLEELESMRLKDLEGLNRKSVHEKCASPGQLSTEYWSQAEKS